MRRLLLLGLIGAVVMARSAAGGSGPRSGDCHRSYPDVCIPSPPPDLDCRDVPHGDFRVLPPDPHRLDGDRDGIGCER